MYSHSSARRWDEALRVMEQLQTVGLQPSRVTFSTAVSTLGRALHWRWAQSLFDSMRRRHSVVTFGAVIGVCERGSQWQGALAQLDRLEARGERSAHRVAVQAVGREFRCGMSWEGRKASKEVFGVQARLPQAYRLESNTVTCTSALGACASGAEWPSASKLLAEALQGQVRVNAPRSGPGWESDWEC